MNECKPLPPLRVVHSVRSKSRNTTSGRGVVAYTPLPQSSLSLTLADLSNRGVISRAGVVHDE